MRFIYGFIMGVLATSSPRSSISRLRGGDYVLQLSPHYHEMTSTIASLKEAKEQRDQLAARLDTLANGFEQLTRRFNELQETTREPAPCDPVPQAEWHHPSAGGRPASAGRIAASRNRVGPSGPAGASGTSAAESRDSSRATRRQVRKAGARSRFA